MFFDDFLTHTRADINDGALLHTKRIEELLELLRGQLPPLPRQSDGPTLRG
jgi:hypothetical protein